jgi:hypothetical protein
VPEDLFVDVFFILRHHLGDHLSQRSALDGEDLRPLAAHGPANGQGEPVDVAQDESHQLRRDFNDPRGYVALLLLLGSLLGRGWGCCHSECSFTCSRGLLIFPLSLHVTCGVGYVFFVV